MDMLVFKGSRNIKQIVKDYVTGDWLRFGAGQRSHGVICLPQMDSWLVITTRIRGQTQFYFILGYDFCIIEAAHSLKTYFVDRV